MRKNSIGVRRRTFMGTSAGLAAAGMFRGLVLKQARADRKGGYGPLTDQAGPDLLLPPGFSYDIISRYGDIMSDGYPTHIAADGMGCFALPNGNVALIRNHEDSQNPANFRPGGFLNGILETHYGPRIDAYDTYGGGGCTILEVEPHGHRRVVRHSWAIVGTTRNCAGGMTPWGSWLTCEETTGSPSGTSYAQRHGYVFNVPLSTLDDGPVTPVPLKFLGRFSHEAAAVDPETNTIYETEDSSPDLSGLFRWVPPAGFDPANIDTLPVTAGTLQMLRVKRPGDPTNRVDIFNAGFVAGQVFDCEWRTLTGDRDPANPTFSNGTALAAQGYAAGATRFCRLEGIWHSNGKMYFHATNGGAAGKGQVFCYDIAANTLTLLLESLGPDHLDNPDNICVTPSGGLVLCEDGPGDQFLRGIGPDGEYFDLARTTANPSEFAGACFSPDGQTLFVNQQGDTSRFKDGSGNVLEPTELDFTYAIRGPWKAGPLG